MPLGGKSDGKYQVLFLLEVNVASAFAFEMLCHDLQVV
jgi:hypothetical protein